MLATPHVTPVFKGLLADCICNEFLQRYSGENLGAVYTSIMKFVFHYRVSYRLLQVLVTPIRCKYLCAV